MAIERVQGVLLDAADTEYLIRALDTLLIDRTPTAQLAAFIDRLRKSVHTSGLFHTR